jgi:serine/threonine protein phosphatase PrpC
MKFQAAARAIRGTKDTQEDAYRVFDAKGADAGEISASGAGVMLSGGGLLLVADGIGGHYGGDVASTITADTFVKTFFAGGGGVEERLKTSLAAANQAIADAQAKDPGLKDMGSTLVAALLEGDTMSFVSIGDSLILRYREGELHRVNEDHSYMEIADREALGSSDPALWRDVITRRGRDSITIAVLGQALEGFGHVPQIAIRKILPGDVLIFASDGLETLTTVQIQNFVRALLPRGVAAVADGLIKAVEGIGGNRSYQDNATLIVAQADGVAPQRVAVSNEAEAGREGASALKDSTAATQASPVANGEPARAGRSTGKVLAGVLLVLAGIVAIFFASGRTDMLHGAMRLLPFPQEQGLQQSPAFTPESDSRLPSRAPKNVTQTPGG